MNDYKDLIALARKHALPDPSDEREVMHAQLLRALADAIESLIAERDAVRSLNVALIKNKTKAPEELAALKQKIASAEPTDEKMREDAEHVKKWVCHNGGLLNEWAKEWNPAKHPPLTAYIRKRLDATIDAARAAEGEK